MIPESASVIDFQPGSPVVKERLILCEGSARQRLMRILTRFGLPPYMVGTAIGGEANQEVHITGRAADGKPTVFARILYGATLGEFEAARTALIEDGWQPTPPTFETTLPNGRDV